MQAPLVSQSVAPQTGSPVVHAALQQFPVPVAPQTPEVQESFSPQATPSSNSAVQVPLWHQYPFRQSPAVVQLVLQLVASAQIKAPGHAAGLETHDPVPSQATVVSALPLQLEAPHEVAFVG